MYYLGDWEDEYCDLTLEKLIELEGENIAKTISTPISKEELILEHQRLKERKNDWVVKSNNVVIKNIDEFNDNTDESRSKDLNHNFFDRVKYKFKRK